MRNAHRHGSGGDAAGLGMADQTIHAAPDLQTDFRQLGGFTGTGFTAKHDHLMGGDRAGDFILALNDGQFLGIVWPGQICQSPGPLCR